MIEKTRNLSPETVGETENFVEFLTEKQKAGQKRDAALFECVNRHAGTDADFDEELEAASAEHLPGCVDILS